MKCRVNGGDRTPGEYPKSGIAGISYVLAVIIIIFSFSLSGATARDAAFIDPGSSAAASEDAIRVEPKGDIDIGDSSLSVAKRTDVFFVNQSTGPIKVEKVSVNGDGNVATEIVTDDCSKQGTIPPGSRCSVEVSLTPSSPGAWSAEVLLTHDGVGRIARAKLTGKTAGTAGGEKKDMGLALDTKEAAPVNFGSVDIGDGKIVRSALMVNDSNDPITLYSIDVIEASNGLEKLDQGCAIDMELKPGESCPVTLIWTPSTPGQISTDLIIRHSGRLGFAVIPIRGVAKGEAKEGDTKSANNQGQPQSSSNDMEAESRQRGFIPPPPPSVPEIEKAAGDKVAAVSITDIKPTEGKTPKLSGKFSLIGTVGNRAIVLKPDGKTEIVSAGDDLSTDSMQVQIVAVSSKAVDLMIDGKKKTVNLDASSVIIEKAKLMSQSKGSKDKDKEMDFSQGPATATGAVSVGPANGAAATGKGPGGAGSVAGISPSNGVSVTGDSK